MRNGTKSNPRRGRPPTYDREQALSAIVETFRRQGFAATSLEDLSTATGMNRPSLNLAFGNKKDMYLTAIERFRGDIVAALVIPTKNPANLAATVRQFFDAAIRFYGSGGSRGCLVLCTATAEAETDDDVRASLGGVLADIETQIVQLIDEAVSAGAHVGDTPSLAKLLSAVFVSISIQSRAGLSSSQLQAFAWSCVSAALPPAEDA
jgi:AcrR family transcriptional regulator